MADSAWSRFAKGVFAGALGAAVLGTVLIYALNMAGVVVVSIPALPSLNELLNLAYENLRSSLVPFALVLWVFFLKLNQLQRLLREASPGAEKVAQVEHLIDICSHLFFGIGVIWTAIGMRAALLFALGDPAAAAEEGAFAILQRLVDGGILLALSTTIVGGIGGYLMRVVKALVVGARLQAFYARSARAQGDEISQTLSRIEERLATLSERIEGGGKGG